MSPTLPLVVRQRDSEFFCPPEAVSNGEYGPQGDIFSAGLVLFALFALPPGATDFYAAFSADGTGGGAIQRPADLALGNDPCALETLVRTRLAAAAKRRGVGVAGPAMAALVAEMLRRDPSARPTAAVSAQKLCELAKRLMAAPPQVQMAPGLAQAEAVAAIPCSTTEEAVRPFACTMNDVVSPTCSPEPAQPSPARPKGSIITSDVPIYPAVALEPAASAIVRRITKCPTNGADADATEADAINLCKDLTEAFANTAGDARVGPALAASLTCVIGSPLTAARVMLAEAACGALWAVARLADNANTLLGARIDVALVTLMRGAASRASPAVARLIGQAISLLGCTDQRRVQFAEAGVTEPLVELLSMPFVGSEVGAGVVAEHLCRAAADLMEGNSECTRLLGEAGLAMPLVALMRARGVIQSTDAVVQLSRALAGLAANNAENRSRLGKAGVATPLVNLLRAPLAKATPTAAEGLSAAVANIAAGNSDNARHLGEAGAPEPLVVLLREFGTARMGVAQQICRALANLAAGWSDNQRLLIEAGVAEPLSALLRTPDLTTSAEGVTQLCRALHGVIAGVPAYAQRLGQYGAAEGVVALMEGRLSATPALGEALASLSASPDNARRLEAAGVAPLLVNLLRTPLATNSVAVAESLVEAVVNLSLSAPSFGQSGVAEPLVALMTALPGVPTQLGLLLIRACVKLCTADPANRDRLGKAGAPKSLAAYMSSAIAISAKRETPRSGYSLVIELAEWACAAVGALANGHPENQRCLGEAGVAVPLVGLLGTPAVVASETALEQVCLAIARLTAGCKDNGSLVGVAEVAPPLTALLLAPVARMEPIAEALFKALTALTDNDTDNQERLGRAGIAKALVTFLREETATRPSIIGRLARTLANLTFSGENARRLSVAGIYHPLVALLHRIATAPEPDLATAEQLLRALANLCAHNSHCDSVRLLGDARVAEPLVEMARMRQLHSDLATVPPTSPTAIAVAEQLGRSLANLSANTANTRLLGSAGIAPQLVALLRLPAVVASNAVAVPLCWAIASMCAPSADNIVRFGEAGATEPLVALLRRENPPHSPELAEQLCRAVCNMSLDPTIRRRFGDAEAIRPLVGLISRAASTPAVTEQVGRAIAALATDCLPNQTRFGEAGVAKPLVTMLRAPDIRVIVAEQLCAAIASVARNCPPNQEAFGVAGAVEILVTLLRAPTRTPEVIQQLCRALDALAAGWTPNQERMGHAGLAEPLVALLDTLQASPTPAMAEALGALLNSFASSADNARALGVIAAVPLVALLRVPLVVMTPPVATSFCAALAKIAAFPDGQRCLGERGAAKVLVVLMRHALALNYAVLVEPLCAATARLADGCPPNVKRLFDESAGPAVVKLLRTAPVRTSPSTAAMAVQALSCLAAASPSPTYLAWLGDAGAPAALIELMRATNSAASIELANALAKAVTVLAVVKGACRSHVDNVRPFVDAHVATALSEQLRVALAQAAIAPAKSAQLTEAALTAILAIAAERGGRSSLKAAGVVELLAQVATTGPLVTKARTLLGK